MNRARLLLAALVLTLVGGACSTDVTGPTGPEAESCGYLGSGTC